MIALASKANDGWLNWVLTVMAFAIGLPIFGALLCSPTRTPPRSEWQGARTARTARSLPISHPSVAWDYWADEDPRPEPDEPPADTDAEWWRWLTAEGES